MSLRAQCLFAGRTRLPESWLAFLLLFSSAGSAQSVLYLHGHVRDTDGRAIASAAITADGPHGTVSTTSAADGSFSFSYPAVTGTVTLHATALSLESDAIAISAPPITDIDLILHPSAVTQQVTVTATRSSLNLPETANTIYVLTASDLTSYPATALDDQLRQQAGFELFRRTSSDVQNPTSQGISLRGLGSTAASRTLVLEDNVPMNDPFGGWIHWDEIPSAAIDAVTLATGGGSDLYGSSALGGVIDVVPARPTTALADVTALGGGQDTSSVSVRGDLGNAQWRHFVAADSFRTAGFVLTAPSLAGPVDVPANVHYQAVRTETDHIFAPSNRTFLIGNMLNEAHGNGTPLTTNGTRLWRYIAGDDWAANSQITGRGRVFGSDEAYRQSFSSVNAARSSETLTRQQHVRTQELGATTDAAFALSPVAFVIGADVRDIRATDNETPISAGSPSGVADTSARQRFVGGFGEALASGHSGLFRNTSAALSLRLDSASNLDTRTLSQTFPSPATTTLTPNRNEFVPSPRFGVVRQIASRATVHASVFRAFRTPTMNELYRTGQIGAQITLANSQLHSERATGWEVGTTYTSPGNLIALAGTYFWTEINRPVSTVLISGNTFMRENLGQILSQGTELHLDLRPGRAISATLGYQYAHAVVTRFSAQPTLIGKWIPDVPRESFTAQLRAQNARLGSLTLAARASGQAWDDSANTLLLARFFSLGLAARHDFGPRWTASLILDNLTNQRPDAARTPILTLASPFLAQGGLAFHWSGAAPR